MEINNISQKNGLDSKKIFEKFEEKYFLRVYKVLANFLTKMLGKDIIINSLH